MKKKININKNYLIILGLISILLFGGIIYSVICLRNNNVGISPVANLGALKSSDKESVLRYLYGNFDSITQSAKWTLLDADIESSSLGKINNNYKDNVFDVKISLSTVTEEGDLMVLTNAVNSKINSAVDGAIIGAFIFKKNGDSWNLANKDKALTVMGEGGNPPINSDLSVVRYGSNKYAFKVMLRGGGQGYETSSVQLIAPEGNRFSRIFQFRTSESNSAVGLSKEHTYSYDSEIILAPVSKSDYFEIKAVQKGTIYTKITDPEPSIKNINEVHTYQFINGKYEEVK